MSALDEDKIELPLDTVWQAISALEYAADVTKSRVVRNSRDRLYAAMRKRIADYVDALPAPAPRAGRPG